MLKFICQNHYVDSVPDMNSTPNLTSSIPINSTVNFPSTPQLTSTNQLLSSNIHQLHIHMKSFGNSDPDILQCIYPIHDIMKSDINIDDIEVNELKKYCSDHYDEHINQIINLNHLNQSFTNDLINNSDNQSKSLIVSIHSMNDVESLTCIELLCQSFKHVILIKPITSNPIDDTIYLLLLSRINLPNNSHHSIRETNSGDQLMYMPLNLNGIIDFLYSFYTYGIYIYNLAMSVITSAPNSQFDTLNQCTEQEYKYYVSRLIDMLKNLDYLPH